MLTLMIFYLLVRRASRNRGEDLESIVFGKAAHVGKEVGVPTKHFEE
jgi:hypothetical protein